MNKELLQMAKMLKGKDPQQMVMQMVQNQQINDPVITQLISYAQTGDTNNLVNLATTMMAQKGMNLNEELQAFMELLM